MLGNCGVSIGSDLLSERGEDLAVAHQRVSRRTPLSGAR